MSPVLAERQYLGFSRETLHYSYLGFQQKGTIHYSVLWYNYPDPEQTLHYRELWYLLFQCAVVYCTSQVPRLRYDRPTGSTKLGSGSEFLGELFFPSPPSDCISHQARAVPRLFSPCQSVCRVHDARPSSSSSVSLYVRRDHKDYQGQGAQDGHLHFHTAPEL